MTFCLSGVALQLQHRALRKYGSVAKRTERALSNGYAAWMMDFRRGPPEKTSARDRLNRTTRHVPFSIACHTALKQFFHPREFIF